MKSGTNKHVTMRRRKYLDRNVDSTPIHQCNAPQSPGSTSAKTTLTLLSNKIKSSLSSPDYDRSVSQRKVKGKEDKRDDRLVIRIRCKWNTLRRLYTYEVINNPLRSPRKEFHIVEGQEDEASRSVNMGMCNDDDVKDTGNESRKRPINISSTYRSDSKITVPCRPPSKIQSQSTITYTHCARARPFFRRSRRQKILSRRVTAPVKHHPRKEIGAKHAIPTVKCTIYKNRQQNKVEEIVKKKTPADRFETFARRSAESEHFQEPKSGLANYAPLTAEEGSTCARKLVYDGGHKYTSRIASNSVRATTESEKISNLRKIYGLSKRAAALRMSCRERSELAQLEKLDRKEQWKLNPKKFHEKRLAVGKSGVHGLGVFAMQSIRKGDFVIEYFGEIISMQVANIRQERRDRDGHGKLYTFTLCKEGGRQLVIDATWKGNMSRYINHSCDPNIEARTLYSSRRWHIGFFALRDIAERDELKFDYLFSYDVGEQKVPCTCNARLCRKFI